MNVRGVLLLALIVVTFIAAVIGLAYIGHLAFVTDEGQLLRSGDALWRSWPVYLGFGMSIALVFALVVTWGLEAAFDEDKIRWQGRIDAEAERAKENLNYERNKFQKEQSELRAAKRVHERSVLEVKRRERDCGAESRRANDKLERAERKMAESKKIVANNKVRMNRLSAQLDRQRKKFAKIDTE